MAEFEVKCPHCKTVLEASDEWIDMETECPVCKGVFTIQRPIVEEIENAVDDQNVPAQTAVQKTFFRSIKFYVIAAVILAAGAIAVILACMIGDNYEPKSNFEFSIEDGNVAIKKYKGTSIVVKIPPKINGRKVSVISEKAFADCQNMTGVVIPEGVNEIGGWAFRDCKGLTSITIPNSVIKIDDWAFAGCNGLTNITIPNKITEIGKCVFYECTSLTSITIPDSVTKIGDSAFSGCSSLTCITIPSSVTEIGESAFKNCKGLTSICIPNSVIKIGGWAFRDCKGLTSITIPGSVTEIDGGVFQGCTSLTGITIPNSVVGPLQVFSFKGCSSLTDVTISNGIYVIEMWAFDGCKSLTKVTIPDSVKEIKDVAFCGCTSLTQVSVPPNIKIAPDAFPKNCKVVFRKAIKIDMSTPLTAKKTYTEAIKNLSDKEVLEFALTWWFEQNRIIAAKGESPFSVAIDLWHDRTLQDRIAFVKEKYPDEFSKKYAHEQERIGKITPEFVLKVRTILTDRFAGKFIRENQSKNDENRWDNSGRIYFR